MPRNQWADKIGITGRIKSESLGGYSWNMQPRETFKFLCRIGSFFLMRFRATHGEPKFHGTARCLGVFMEITHGERRKWGLIVSAWRFRENS